MSSELFNFRFPAMEESFRDRIRLAAKAKGMTTGQFCYEVLSAAAPAPDPEKARKLAYWRRKAAERRERKFAAYAKYAAMGSGAD
jgi:hypothetical protein